jgi:hypothetical protein
MARWTAIFCGFMVVAMLACGWTMSSKWRRAQVMHFGANRCYDIELRPWGIHALVAKYDRGFPRGLEQPSGPGWKFVNQRAADRNAYVPPQWQRLGLGLGSTTMRDELYGGPTVFVTVPYWMAALPPACVGGFSLWRWRRQRRRSHGGRCPACGYDLRATPQRCPECGRTAPTVPTPAGSMGTTTT